MRTIHILILTLFLSVYVSAQTLPKDKVEPYTFDTTLKGGYTILFKANDSLEYLYLKKDNKVISELSSMSTRLPYLNLGYVGADFKDYFVLVHSFGGGNPHWIQIFQKSTGKNILNKWYFWIGVDTASQTILYSRTDVPKPKDKMTLLDLKTMEHKDYPFPKKIFGEPEILNRIKLLNVTDTTFTIKYSCNNWETEQKKIYSR